MRHLLQFPTILIAISIVSLITGCKSKSGNNESIITALNENLDRSNRVINYSTMRNMKELQDKSQDFCTKERAAYWYPQAKSIVRLSKTLYDYIETIKSSEHFNSVTLNILAEKTKSYKDSVLATDSSLYEEFKDKFQPTGLLPANEQPVTISLLASIQNDIKVFENITTTYCNIKVGCTIMIFDTYNAIVGQNSNILNPGSQLEINAGIGAYSKAASPKITIKGKLYEINEMGFVVYKTKVQQNPGNYKVPVIIKYSNLITGKEETKQINVEYTVKDCN